MSRTSTFGIVGGYGATGSAVAAALLRRDYWINGLVPAPVARMISEGKSVEPGLRYLADAVGPITLMAELKKEGVEQTKNFAPCPS